MLQGEGGAFGFTTWVLAIGILGAWMEEIICHWGECHRTLIYQAMRGSAFSSGDGKQCEGRETEQESKHLSHVCRFASTECLEVEAEAAELSCDYSSFCDAFGIHL